MLAQGQSSSAKREGLAADVSSEIIFVKKKKNYHSDFSAKQILRLSWGQDVYQGALRINTCGRNEVEAGWAEGDV